MIVIDASDAIAGRLAAEVARMLLKGEQVRVVNAERAVISGDPTYTEGIMKERSDRGDPYHGPFFPKQPDRMLKRIVRGMLPYKKPRGRDALKRLRVYISVPAVLEGREAQRIKEAENKLECKWKSLGDLSLKLGGKKTW